jgi:predicted polyphosphate/ATP-dependent NAD kinase
MKFLETKEIQVADRKFFIRLTARAIIEYDALTGRNFWVDFGGEEIKTEKLTQLFYTTAKAGAKNKGIKFDYSYDDFLDVIDDHPEIVAVFFQMIRNPEEGEQIKKK